MWDFRRMTRPARRLRRWLSGTLAFAALLPGLTSTMGHAHAELARAPTGGTAPLWEVGIAGGGVYGADYPAADERSVRGHGHPYVIYRGDIFRLGGDGPGRGRIVDEGLLEFDIGIDASFDVDSGGNRARSGMPDLGYLFEISPQALFDLGTLGGGGVTFGIPVRAVFSTDFSRIEYRGLIVDPEVTYRRGGLFGTALGASASLAVAFAGERLQDYFYQVDPAYRTAGRPAHDATGGYLGTDLAVGFVWPAADRLNVVAEGHLSFHGGAANADSPLFRDRLNWAVGLGLRWSLYESDTRVPWRK